MADEKGASPPHGKSEVSVACDLDRFHGLLAEGNTHILEHACRMTVSHYLIGVINGEFLRDSGMFFYVIPTVDGPVLSPLVWGVSIPMDATEVVLFPE